jgi:hypothetical protein
MLPIVKTTTLVAKSSTPSAPKIAVEFIALCRVYRVDRGEGAHQERGGHAPTGELRAETRDRQPRRSAPRASALTSRDPAPPHHERGHHRDRHDEHQTDPADDRQLTSSDSEHRPRLLRDQSQPSFASQPMQ